MLDLERDDELAAFVSAKAREHRVPGLSVGVIHDGHTFAVTHGVTSTRDPLDVDADTLFMIGSTTKTLTGTALMRLVDDGRLTLKDRVIDHLPDFRVADPKATHTVTVGQLLNHTSGWRGDALPATGFGDDGLTRAMQVVAEGPQEFPTGQHTSYNNAALMVAGRVLEVLTGQTYEAAVTDLVLSPLGLNNTFFSPWEVANRRLAVGHILRADREEPVPTWPTRRAIAPAGGAISSLRDQLAYAAYHLDGTTQLTAPLAEATRLLMQQPTAEMKSVVTEIGITWLLTEQSGVRLVSHGGNINNLQTSAFHLAPDHGLALIVMGNSSGGAAVGADVLDWCIEHYLGRPRRTPLATLPLTPDLLTQYVGVYDLGPWSLEVTATADKLFVQKVLPDGAAEELKALFSKPPTEMSLVGPDQVAPSDNPVAVTADFVRDASGAIAWFRSGMRMARRVEVVA